MNQTDLRSFVMCGLCEDYKYEVPVVEDDWGDWSITVDGLMQLREQGWEYDGISWRCPDCVAMEADDDAAN